MLTRARQRNLARRAQQQYPLPEMARWYDENPEYVPMTRTRFNNLVSNDINPLRHLTRVPLKYYPSLASRGPIAARNTRTRSQRIWNHYVNFRNREIAPWYTDDEYKETFLSGFDPTEDPSTFVAAPPNPNAKPYKFVFRGVDLRTTYPGWQADATAEPNVNILTATDTPTNSTVIASKILAFNFFGTNTFPRRAAFIRRLRELGVTQTGNYLVFQNPNVTDMKLPLSNPTAAQSLFHALEGGTSPFWDAYEPVKEDVRSSLPAFSSRQLDKLEQLIGVVSYLLEDESNDIITPMFERGDEEQTRAYVQKRGRNNIYRKLINPSLPIEQTPAHVISARPPNAIVTDSINIGDLTTALSAGTKNPSIADKIVMPVGYGETQKMATFDSALVKLRQSDDQGTVRAVEVQYIQKDIEGNIVPGAPDITDDPDDANPSMPNEANFSGSAQVLTYDQAQAASETPGANVEVGHFREKQFTGDAPLNVLKKGIETFHSRSGMDAMDPIAKISFKESARFAYIEGYFEEGTTHNYTHRDSLPVIQNSRIPSIKGLLEGYFQQQGNASAITNIANAIFAYGKKVPMSSTIAVLFAPGAQTVWKSDGKIAHSASMNDEQRGLLRQRVFPTTVKIHELTTKSALQESLITQLAQVFDRFFQFYEEVDIATSYTFQCCYMTTASSGISYDIATIPARRYLNRHNAVLPIFNINKQCRLYAILIGYCHVMAKKPLATQYYREIVYRFQEMTIEHCKRFLENEEDHFLIATTADSYWQSVLNITSFLITTTKDLLERLEYTDIEPADIKRNNFCPSTIQIQRLVNTIGMKVCVYSLGQNFSELTNKRLVPEGIEDEEEIANLDTVMVLQTDSKGQSHFDTILKPTSKHFGNRCICSVCGEVSSNPRTHNCKGFKKSTQRQCHTCKKTFPTPEELQQHRNQPHLKIKCDDCNLLIPEQCFPGHKQHYCNEEKIPGKVRCPNCKLVYFTKGRFKQDKWTHDNIYCEAKGKPGFMNCHSCGGVANKDHTCFLKRVNFEFDADEYDPTVYYVDAESVIDKTATEIIDGIETSTFVVNKETLNAERDDELTVGFPACGEVHRVVHFSTIIQPKFMDLLHDFKAATNGDEERIVHNRIYERLRENPMRHDTMETFTEWALDQEATFIAHNGGSYDWWLMMVYLFSKGISPDTLVSRGNNIMILKYGKAKFIDSLRFVPTSLARFPKLMGLQNMGFVEKDVFPYHYLTSENLIRYKNITDEELQQQPYAPTREYYAPISDADYNEYRERFGPDNPWHLINEMIYYCDQDVIVLAMCFMAFQLMFSALTNVPPLVKNTLAGYVLHVFRQKYLPENTVPLFEERHVPVHGGKVFCTGGYFMNPQVKEMIQQNLVDMGLPASSINLPESPSPTFIPLFEGHTPAYTQKDIETTTPEERKGDPKFDGYVEPGSNIAFHLDFNSLYPDSQLQPYPVGPLTKTDYTGTHGPNGMACTDEYIESLRTKGGFGVFHITSPRCNNPNWVPVLPIKTKIEGANRLICPLGSHWYELSISEVVVASQKWGYTVNFVRQTYTTESMSDKVFKESILNMVEQKIKYSAPPETEEEAQETIEDMSAIGLDLDMETLNAPHRPGLRALTKLYLNCGWGKLAQRMYTTTGFLTPNQFEGLLRKQERGEVSIKTMNLVADDRMQVEYQELTPVEKAKTLGTEVQQNDFSKHAQNTSHICGMQTTAHAMMTLHDLVSNELVCGKPFMTDEELKQPRPARALYGDTDSCIIEGHLVHDSRNTQHGTSIYPDVTKIERVSRTCLKGEPEYMRINKALGSLDWENKPYSSRGNRMAILAVFIVSVKMYSKLIVEVDDLGRIVDDPEIEIMTAGKGLPFKKIKKAFINGTEFEVNNKTLFVLYGYMVANNAKVDFKIDTMFIKYMLPIDAEGKQFSVAKPCQMLNPNTDTACISTQAFMKRTSHNPSTQKRDAVNTNSKRVYPPPDFIPNEAIHRTKQFLENKHVYFDPTLNDNKTFEAYMGYLTELTSNNPRMPFF